jgi:hypothetical protein
MGRIIATRGLESLKKDNRFGAGTNVYKNLEISWIKYTVLERGKAHGCTAALADRTLGF